MKKLFSAAAALLFFCTAANAADIDTHLLDEMLTTVNTFYIKPVDNAKLVTAGLQALGDADPGFTVSRGTDRIYIYYNLRMITVVSDPEDANDIAAWTRAETKALQDAAAVSEKVSLRDFEMPDLVMKRMVQTLDEHSHYYSEYEYEEEDEESSVYTLFADRMTDDILYMRIRVFNRHTAESVKNSLENHPDAKGVILDLRGNGGGIFNEALKTAKLFCDDEIITYTAGRGGKDKHYYTTGKGALYSGPLAVLTDEKTASAAEVLSGGLQDLGRAEIIGTHTFGKGTIQKVITMSDGGKLAITNRQFFTPSGRVIHKKGIEPDICTGVVADGRCMKTEDGVSDADSDIETAAEYLHRQNTNK